MWEDNRGELCCIPIICPTAIDALESKQLQWEACCTHRISQFDFSHMLLKHFYTTLLWLPQKSCSLSFTELYNSHLFMVGGGSKNPAKGEELGRGCYLAHNHVWRRMPEYGSSATAFQYTFSPFRTLTVDACWRHVLFGSILDLSRKIHPYLTARWTKR